jgi:hypothetical protein
MKAYTLTSTDLSPFLETAMNTPIRIRAAALAASVLLSLVVAEAVALIGLPPASAQALVLALAAVAR